MSHRTRGPRKILPTRIGAAALSACASMSCATLGPMPGMTGVSATPNPRPGVEAQVAAVPGFFLSNTVDGEGGGAPLAQASGMIEPGDTIGVPGLALGARYVDGRDGPGIIEPMTRYRAPLDDRLSAAVVGFGTSSSGSVGRTSYSLTRGGAEGVVGWRLTPRSRWAELHLEAGAGLTVFGAQGDYCTNDNGYARDCDTETKEAPNTHADVDGVLPSFHVGANGDFARHLELPLHGLRLAIWLAGGWMPHVQVEDTTRAARTAEPRDRQRQWTSAGLGLSLDFGGSRAPDGSADSL